MTARKRYKTKYEPPELDEALYAAEGLTDDLEEQVRIAASLMGVSTAEAAEAQRLRAERPEPEPTYNSRTPSSSQGRGHRSGRSSGEPEVVVIHKRGRNMDRGGTRSPSVDTSGLRDRLLGSKPRITLSN